MHVRARRAHSTAQAHRRPAAAAIPRGPPALGMISAAGEAGKGAGAYVLSAPIDIMHTAGTGSQRRPHAQRRPVDDGAVHRQHTRTPVISRSCQRRYTGAPHALPAARGRRIGE